MTERRLIISGTREALSAEERDLVLDIVRLYADLGWVLGVGDCFRRRRDGSPIVNVDWLVHITWPEARVFYADWDRLGDAAGPERNGRMGAWAREVSEASLGAFPGPQSRGTWDCIGQWRRARALRPELGLIVQAVGR
jgi:hypothetical protein